MDKATLRKEFLAKRQNLSRSAYWMFNDDLLEQLKGFDFSGTGVLHIFLPIKHHKEVDTFAIIEFLKSNHPEIEIVIPRTNFKDHTMENVVFDPLHTVLRQNQFGIPEPVYGNVIDPLKIDAVFMPLLAFDKLGNRVGYGKGFYDRFISGCRPDLKKIGLSLFDPVDEIIDINESDRKMDYCVTPEKIWEFDKLA